MVRIRSVTPGEYPLNKPGEDADGLGRGPGGAEVEGGRPLADQVC